MKIRSSPKSEPRTVVRPRENQAQTGVTSLSWTMPLPADIEKLYIPGAQHCRCRVSRKPPSRSFLPARRCRASMTWTGGIYSSMHRGPVATSLLSELVHLYAPRLYLSS